MRTDPTQTLTFRNKAVSEVNRRFGQVRRLFLIALRDVRKPKGILINEDIDLEIEEIEQLLIFLQTLIASHILVDDAVWLSKYIQASYERGAIKANIGINRGQSEKTPFVSLNNPRHRRVVKLIKGRNLAALEGVTEAMSTQIHRAMTDGVLTGKGLREIGNDVSDRVNKIGITRAKLMARTEIIKANNLALISETRIQAAYLDEELKVKWIATLDSRVRDKHRGWHNQILTLEVATSRLGEPNCRCALSVVVSN